MTKIFKKLLYLFCLLVSLLFVFYDERLVYASYDEIKVNIIFDNLNYNKNDTIYISLNIFNVYKVNEIKLGINNSSEIDTFVDFDNNIEVNKSSGFSKELINEANNNEGIRLYLQKESEIIQETICSIKLTCEKDITDIVKLISSNLTIYLFDDQNNLLEYQLSYSEKLKATWNILLDEIEVYSTVPNYSESFFVMNRREDEYEIILKQNIDSSIIGTQVVSIIVIDKINNDYLLFNKTIDVVDKTIPCISYPNEIIIDDINIDSLNLEQYINVVDNYDDNAYIVYSYYNKEEEALSYDLFIEYLKNNKQGFICFYGVDQSKNETDEVTIEIIINDVTPPTISTTFIDNLIIKDIELEIFDLLSCFSIFDEYDSHPMLLVEVYDKNKQLVDNYKDKILKEKTLKLIYYGYDNNNNKTNVVETNILLEDTISPVISGESEVIINDYEITDNFYLNDLDYSDNIDLTPVLEIIFYIGEEKVNKYVFIEKIKSGNNGCILFQAIDSTNNRSEIFTRKVKVIDTTPPSINLINIKEEGKYLKIEEINYEVKDNFVGEIDVFVEVNGYEYNNTLINDVGEYSVIIYAKDKSGNESKKEFTFTIIENNIQGCSGDVKCYIDNYLNVIIVVTVLTICTIALVVVKIIVEKKKDKNKIKEIKNENI